MGPKSILICSAKALALICLSSVASITVLAQDASPSPTPVATPSSTPTPALTADQKKQIADAQSAIKAVDSAIARAEDRRKTASAQVDTLNSLTSSKKADDAALRDLDDLADVVGDVGDGKFLAGDADHTSLKELAAAEAKRKTAHDALPGTGTQPDEIVAARAATEAAEERLKAETEAVKTTRKDLTTAVAKVYTFASVTTASLSKILDPLATLDTGALGDKVRQVLPRQLANLKEVERLSRALGPLIEALKTKLDATGVAQPATPPVDLAKDLATLRSRVNEMVKRALGTAKKTDGSTPPGWLETLKGTANTEANNVAAIRNQVRSDPAQFSAAAVVTSRAGSSLLDDVRMVVLGWTALEGELPEATDLDFDSRVAGDLGNGLELSARNIKGSLADLQDALAGDFKDFEADQVSLFYFTDVPRLMQMLNQDTYEIGGIKTASEEAASQRRSLTSAELDLADAQSAVNAAQQRVIALREEQRQAKASAASTNQIFKKTGLSLKGAQRDKELNDKRFTDAQCNPMPTDPDKRAQCESAASERDRAAVRLEEADRRSQDADEDRKKANERNDSLNAEQNGLPSKIAEAESKLDTAQAAVNRQRRTALLAAQAESEAFAKSRDNRPFWFAPANASSNDPVKHVLLWAFNDSKTVFMRGKRTDLDLVKCIIAKIDQPAPQARMTLWTLELSSDSSVGGAKKTNESLEIVERRLSNSRALNAAALSLFRDAINERVNEVAQAALTQAENARNAPCPVGGCPAFSLLDTSDRERLARLTFYHPEVLKRLGFNPNRLFDRSVTNPDLARLIVPDPAGTTTLGEALMVLSLGKQGFRAEIMKRFLQSLSTQLPELGLPKELDSLVGKKNADGTWFPSLRRAINLDGFGKQTSSGHENLSRAQLEHLREMLAGIAGRTPVQNEQLIQQVAGATSRDQQLLTVSQAGLNVEQVTSLFNGTPVHDGLSFSQLEILHAMEQVAQDRLLAFTKTLYLQYLLRGKEIRSKRAAANLSLSLSDPICHTPEEFKEMAARQRTPAQIMAEEEAERAAKLAQAEADTKLRAEIETEIKAQGKVPKETEVQAAVTAARERRVAEVKALENEYCAMAKELRALFGKLEGTGISWERVTRIFEMARTSSDPDAISKADGEFKHLIWERSCTSGLRIANAREAAADQMLKEIIIAVEDDLDRQFVQPMLKGLREDLLRKGIGVGILQRTSVLATNRLLARVDPRASAQLPLGQTTDVLQAAQQLSQIFFAAQSAGPLGALGALQGLPGKPPAELYGLTTGNVFQVTPIFDPSGQALRFKFDYVSASQIREPNGTVNPQLPRIERHTVNTEVQLSNLELREISRYESNARLGIATRYDGGLPIFRDLPYIRYIPLIGWFVRTSGKAAVTQQSLIFGQSTMYPTIGDIMGLLTSDADTNLSKEPTP